MHSKSLKRSLLAALVTLVIGCSKKPPHDIIAIDFSSENYSEQVAEVTGLSGKEPWGRWSDANVAPTVIIRLKQPLPTKFTLSIAGQSAQKGAMSTLHIGEFKEDFLVQDVGDEVAIPVKLNSPQSIIEIIPANPRTPKELGVNGDTRKLGIGLITLKIQE